MTSSERAIAFCVVLAVAAGYIAGEAWPQPDAPIPRPLAVFCVVLVLALTAIVMHTRRGRP